MLHSYFWSILFFHLKSSVWDWYNVIFFFLIKQNVIMFLITKKKRTQSSTWLFSYNKIYQILRNYFLKIVLYKKTAWNWFLFHNDDDENCIYVCRKSKEMHEQITSTCLKFSTSFILYLLLPVFFVHVYTFLVVL